MNWTWTWYSRVGALAWCVYAALWAISFLGIVLRPRKARAFGSVVVVACIVMVAMWTTMDMNGAEAMGHMLALAGSLIALGVWPGWTRLQLCTALSCLGVSWVWTNAQMRGIYWRGLTVDVWERHVAMNLAIQFWLLWLMMIAGLVLRQVLSRPHNARGLDCLVIYAGGGVAVALIAASLWLDWWWPNTSLTAPLLGLAWCAAMGAGIWGARLITRRARQEGAVS